MDLEIGGIHIIVVRQIHRQPIGQACVAAADVWRGRLGVVCPGPPVRDGIASPRDLFLKMECPWVYPQVTHKKV